MHITPSGKKYIGITCKEKVTQRWGKGSGYKKQPYFYKAIQKYGWENIEHIIIAEGLEEETAKQMEKDLIRKYESNNKEKGYNLTIGGDGVVGYQITEEVRKKLSDAQKGEKNHRYGFHYTEEEKEKIRQRSKEKATEQWSKEGAKEKHSELMKKKMQEFYKTEKGKEHLKTLAKKNRRSKTLLNKPKGVICLETKCFFCSMSSAEKYYGINKSNIYRSCKNKRNAKTKTGLHWRIVNYKHNKILRRKETS